jgi:hypothetical protein
MMATTTAWQGVEITSSDMWTLPQDEEEFENSYKLGRRKKKARVLAPTHSHTSPNRPAEWSGKTGTHRFRTNSETSSNRRAEWVNPTTMGTRKTREMKLFTKQSAHPVKTYSRKTDMLVWIMAMFFLCAVTGEQKAHTPKGHLRDNNKSPHGNRRVIECSDCGSRCVRSTKIPVKIKKMFM